MPGVEGLPGLVLPVAQPAGPSPRAVRHEELVAAVTGLYTKEAGRAGRDQLTLLLNAAGTKVSAPTVGAIMRENGLRAIRTQAWKRTTVQDPQAKTAHIENHMLDDQGKRDFTSTVPGTRLVGDITYLRTGEGWLYLATVIDLFSGMVIGWTMAEHMRASLCTAALRMARNHGHFAEHDVVFHSDRGTQYTSDEFQRWCGDQRGHPVHGQGRGVLGQRGRRELLLPPQNRVLPPRTLRFQARCPDRGHGLHRGLVQPPPTQPQGRRHPRQPPPTRTTKPATRNPWPPNQKQR